MLSWNTTNATSCTASGGWTGPEPTSGAVSTGAVDATTTYTLNCTGIGGSGSGLATVTVPNPNQFLVTPRNAALTLGQSQQFTATVPGAASPSWSVDGVPGGNASVGTISAIGLYTPPGVAGTHVVVATSAANPAQTGTASVAVTDLAGVYTYHNDAARTGQNLQDGRSLPPPSAAAPSASSGRARSMATSMPQPLYIASLPIAGGTHNVVILATQHDSVYAFDADNPGCVTYWHASLLAGGAASIPQSDTGCADIPVEYGITGTPVPLTPRAGRSTW